MATYPNDIEQLDGLTSGAQEVVAPAIVQGANLDIAHVVAATGQYKDRKRLAAKSIPQATAEEVATAKRRKHQLESFNFDGPTPAWAQMMQQQLQQQGETQKQMHQEFGVMQQQMLTMMQLIQSVVQVGRQQQETSQRMENRRRRSDADPICKLIRVSDGTSPGSDLWFPASLMELIGAPAANVNLLLDFYGLPHGGDITAMRTALTRHLGIAP